MAKLLWLAAVMSLTLTLHGQGFEVTAPQENVKGVIGEVVKAPIRFKNNSERSLTIVIKKISSQLGSTQKNFYCIDNNCLDSKIEDYIIKIEPGQTLNSVQIAIEGGLVAGESSIKYIAYNRYNPSESIEFDLNFIVEEKLERQRVYSSTQISIYEIYPNPAGPQAFVDYKIFNSRVKARVVIHNILGNVVSDYELSPMENKVKIKTAEFNPGIYFYTLYLDGKSVFTRKLVVNPSP